MVSKCQYILNIVFFLFRFRYPLMGTTLVIEDVTVRQPGMRKRKRNLHTVLKNFKRFMSTNGCRN